MRRAWLLASMLALGGCSEFWRGTWFGPDGPPTWPVGPSPPGVHRVEAGETLYSIAFRNQMDYHLLAEWNGLGTQAVIKPGQLLRLTEPPGGVAPRREPADKGTGTAPRGASPARHATTPALPRGPLRWKWPVPGKRLRAFSGGGKGMDIACESGSPVLAAAAGRVVYSGSGLRGYGELVIVKHDEVYLSAYGYNRARLVKEGDAVRSGQLLAECGLGPEQKPMLHFEVRERGTPIDPESLLPRR